MANLVLTQINNLKKVSTSMTLRQKMNRECTQLILTEKNQLLLDKAQSLINEAIKVLNEIN